MGDRLHNNIIITMMIHTTTPNSITPIVHVATVTMSEEKIWNLDKHNYKNVYIG